MTVPMMIAAALAVASRAYGAESGGDMAATNITPCADGLVIVATSPGPGRDAGIRELDVITMVDDQPVATVEEFRAAIAADGEHRLAIARPDGEPRIVATSAKRLDARMLPAKAGERIDLVPERTRQLGAAMLKRPAPVSHWFEFSMGDTVVGAERFAVVVDGESFGYIDEAAFEMGPEQRWHLCERGSGPLADHLPNAYAFFSNGERQIGGVRASDSAWRVTNAAGAQAMAAADQLVLPEYYAIWLPILLADVRVGDVVHYRTLRPDGVSPYLSALAVVGQEDLAIAGVPTRTTRFEGTELGAVVRTTWVDDRGVPVLVDFSGARMAVATEAQAKSRVWSGFAFQEGSTHAP
ncbi:MAG TPA: hypothetical protein VEL07_16090 [Planctomycetota bacterium]|nr:hypothetical protein [Planctomycetota bacterium]